uniref:Uncharacterized protein n=1 Tax=Caenorhabditis japonica TaxID=281687 RepID=A0A8R1EU04_CAEJA
MGQHQTINKKHSAVWPFQKVEYAFCAPPAESLLLSLEARFVSASRKLSLLHFLVHLHLQIETKPQTDTLPHSLSLFCPSLPGGLREKTLSLVTESAI